MRQPLKLAGQTFGRLTVIERAPNPQIIKTCSDAHWKCICSCGKTTIVRAYKLKTGHTLSCGCLKREAPHLPLLPQSQPIYSLEETAVRNAWRTRYKDLPLHYFWRIAQELCFYCGAEPHLLKTIERKDGSFTFAYNTLDRIDSNKGYLINNVVPACYTCNIAKNTRSIINFYAHIDKLIDNMANRKSPEQYRQKILNTNLLFTHDLHYARLTSLKTIYAPYNKGGDLTLEQFFKLTSSNCYYCLTAPSNRQNACSKLSSKHAIENSTYFYNGLDRIDSNINTHNLDNIIPSCKWCNWAKNDLTIQQFDEWILRLKSHLPYRHYPAFSASSIIDLASSSGSKVFSASC